MTDDQEPEDEFVMIEDDDSDEEPDGTGDDPHPMGPHGTLEVDATADDPEWS